MPKRSCGTGPSANDIQTPKPKTDPRVLASRKKARRSAKLTMHNKKARRAETARNLRRRKRVTKTDSMVLASNARPTGLLDRLMFHVTHALRGKRLYTKGLIETIAKVGSCPSAGGSRSPIARILSHMGDLYFLHKPRFNLGLRKGFSSDRSF